jgi:hypothetical protein
MSLNNSKNILKLEQRRVLSTTIGKEFYSLGYSAVHRKANCSACGQLHSRFLLGLFFDPETGGDMFLRNVG